jgi:hypothetical protein
MRDRIITWAVVGVLCAVVFGFVYATYRDRKQMGTLEYEAEKQWKSRVVVHSRVAPDPEGGYPVFMDEALDAIKPACMRYGVCVGHAFTAVGEDSHLWIQLIPPFPDWQEPVLEPWKGKSRNELQEDFQQGFIAALHARAPSNVHVVTVTFHWEK